MAGKGLVPLEADGEIGNGTGEAGPETRRQEGRETLKEPAALPGFNKTDADCTVGK